MKKHYKLILSQLEICKSIIELNQIHTLMIKSSVIKNIIPLSKLIDFCTNTPNTTNLSYAISIFETINSPSVYIWNSIIKGYTNSSNPVKSFTLFQSMLRNGYPPNHFTFPYILKACSVSKKFPFGTSVHGFVTKRGFEVNMYVSTCLLHMYMCCGEVNYGVRVFEKIPKWNIVAWGSLISGFVNNNRLNDAFQAFSEMEGYGLKVNESIMVDLIVACGRSKFIVTGKWLHGLVQGLGFGDNVILSTSLVDMYGKCGDMRTARYLFDEMLARNLVTWNSIINGYSLNGNVEEAMRMFSEMRFAGFAPDKVTFLSLIKAESRQTIHGYVLKTGFLKDTAIVCAVMNMYAVTDDVSSVMKSFEELEKKDTVAWTVVIIGLASHGHGNEALTVFNRMQAEGNSRPDGITYLGVLYACSHVGLVDEGRRYFAEMKDLYGIEPTVEHYGCMVDILSRSGCFEDAESLVMTMPVQSNASVYGALLNGCEIHENLDLADRVKSMMTESEGSGIYTLLSNIYTKAGRWNDAKLVRESMKSRKITKLIGQSFVETNNI